jgi:hypothetical protein
VNTCPNASSVKLGYILELCLCIYACTEREVYIMRCLYLKTKVPTIKSKGVNVIFFPIVIYSGGKKVDCLYLAGCGQIGQEPAQVEHLTGPHSKGRYTRTRIASLIKLFK